MSDPHMPPKDDNNDAQKQLEAQLQGRLNFRASCKARVRPGRASGSIPVF